MNSGVYIRGYNLYLIKSDLITLNDPSWEVQELLSSSYLFTSPMQRIAESVLT